MECKYIFFDWGYTLISKFENVDDKINKILEKIINPEKVITKLMLLAGSFILILNQFTLEYLLFPESAVMCLGVLFNVIAIKFMVDNPKCKYIKIFLLFL